MLRSDVAAAVLGTANPRRSSAALVLRAFRPDGVHVRCPHQLSPLIWPSLRTVPARLHWLKYQTSVPSTKLLRTVRATVGRAAVTERLCRGGLAGPIHLACARWCVFD